MKKDWWQINWKICYEREFRNTLCVSASLCIGARVTRASYTKQPFKPLTVNREARGRGLGGAPVLVRALITGLSVSFPSIDFVAGNGVPLVGQKDVINANVEYATVYSRIHTFEVLNGSKIFFFFFFKKKYCPIYWIDN